jgi:hypothetical protein
VLLFGPRAGKSHLAAAIGLALVENGWHVLFTHIANSSSASKSRAAILASKAQSQRSTSIIPGRLQIGTPGRHRRNPQAREGNDDHPPINVLKVFFGSGDDGPATGEAIT